MTLLLTRSTVEAALQIDEALDMLSRGFCATTNRPRPQRIRTDLPGPGTATCLIPGLLPDIPAYTVKVNAKFPASSPALRGVVCLHDINTGDLLALADSASVTAWRTGLSAALGTHVLADPAARTLGFVGAGAQARMVATGLRTLRSFDQTVATDLDRRRAADLADVVVDDARAVAARCDIVILATWSRVPLLHAEDIATVTHLTTLGADEPGKIELAADVLRRSRVMSTISSSSRPPGRWATPAWMPRRRTAPWPTCCAASTPPATSRTAPPFTPTSVCPGRISRSCGRSTSVPGTPAFPRSTSWPDPW